MLRKMLIGGVMAIAAAAGSAGTGHAGVSVDLGIHFETPRSSSPYRQARFRTLRSLG